MHMPSRTLRWSVVPRRGERPGVEIIIEGLASISVSCEEAMKLADELEFAAEHAERIAAR